jgi:hypothetical protein
MEANTIEEEVLEAGREVVFSVAIIAIYPRRVMNITQSLTPFYALSVYGYLSYKTTPRALISGSS